MEAPEKIYVSIGPRQSLIARAGQTLKSDIEYIRKDALMKWAEDFRANTGWYEIEVAMDDLIDKLNSM